MSLTDRRRRDAGSRMQHSYLFDDGTCDVMAPGGRNARKRTRGMMHSAYMYGDEFHNASYLLFYVMINVIHFVDVTKSLVGLIREDKKAVKSCTLFYSDRRDVVLYFL